MSKPRRVSVRAEWAAAILVCGKCSKKFDAAFRIEWERRS